MKRANMPKDATHVRITIEDKERLDRLFPMDTQWQAIKKLLDMAEQDQKIAA